MRATSRIVASSLKSLHKNEITIIFEQSIIGREVQMVVIVLFGIFPLNLRSDGLLLKTPQNEIITQGI